MVGNGREGHNMRLTATTRYFEVYYIASGGSCIRKWARALIKFLLRRLVTLSIHQIMLYHWTPFSEKDERKVELKAESDSVII